MKYRNPVVSGFHPDPSICRCGDDFYLVMSSFEYFPGVPIYHSNDLVNWELIGHCLTNETQLPLKHAGSSAGIFAPTIRYHQGIFYMITTNISAGGNFFVYTDDPRGDWSEPIFLKQPGIDPDLFFCEKGDVYITTSADLPVHGPGVYQSKINIKTGELLTEPAFIWGGTGGRYPEAPHIYKRGEWYYLILAEGGTEYEHMETIARSRNPEGPYKEYEKNPILSHRSTGERIQSTGHADFVEFTDGNWWAVFLGTRPVGYPKKHHLGRETFLAPITWTENEWPKVGNEGIVGEQVTVNHTVLREQVTDVDITDDFIDDSLAFEWNFLRNPEPNSWLIETESSRLKLIGNEKTLNEVGNPSFVGRRQQHFNCQATASLSFSPKNEGEESGLTVYMNERFHYEIAVIKINGVKKVIYKRRVGSLWKVEKEIPIQVVDVILSVRADETLYHFGYSEQGKDIIWLGTAECAMLSTEIAGGFTGVMLAMYATGNGEQCSTPAYFNWFRYQGKM